MPTSGLFSRNLKKAFPIAARGEGCWIVDESGRRFLDAAGQAAVVSIGHGVAEIGHAMAEQSAQIAFAHTSQFHSEPAEKLAVRLLALARRIFATAGAFTSRAAAPKRRKRQSKWSASITWKPGKRSATA